MSQSGAAFTKVGTYKVLHHTNPTWEGIFIEKYDLLDLEAAAQLYKNQTDVGKLEENLNKLYKLSGYSRSSYLPLVINKTVNVSFSEILEMSENYVQELSLFSKNTFDLKFLEDIQKETFMSAHDDEERTYFYPTIFEHFDDMKKFLRFHLNFNISASAVYINVTMTVPYAEDGSLYEITYIPVLKSSGEVTFLKDQSMTHVIDSHYSLRYETDLDSCFFKNEVFLCNSKKEKIKHLLNEENFCLTNLYKGQVSDSCSYVEAETDLFELTSLGNGNFYYLLKAPKKYSYECSDGEIEMGYLQGSGVVTLDANCSLTTPFESIFYNGEIEELTIYISEDSAENEIYGMSSVTFIVIVSITGTILMVALYVTVHLWIKRRNQYRYMYV